MLINWFEYSKTFVALVIILNVGMEDALTVFFLTDFGGAGWATAAATAAAIVWSLLFSSLLPTLSSSLSKTLSVESAGSWKAVGSALPWNFYLIKKKNKSSNRILGSTECSRLLTTGSDIYSSIRWTASLNAAVLLELINWSLYSR